MAVVVKVAVVLFVYVCLVVLVFSLMRVSALADRRAERLRMQRPSGAPISPAGRVEGADGRAPRAAGAATAVPYRID